MSQQEDKSHSGLDALWIFEFSPPGVEKNNFKQGLL